MISNDAVQAFLATRIAVVGASDDKSSFGGTVYRELRDHGCEVVPVHPSAETVAGDPCYPTLAAVPGTVGGALVMVNRARAPEVVQACAERGVERVWLFKGIGGPGAVSDEAVRLCRDNGMEVIEGACPLMFLEPVGMLHRIHRGFRHLNGSLSRAA
jgi:predicted CoA-binding protein